MLLMAAMAMGAGTAWADITSPWTYTFAKSGSAEFSGYGDDGEGTINGVTWILDATWGSAGSANPSVDGTSGLKIGSNSKAPESMTFTTSDITGTITSIKITTNCRSKANSILTAKVGATAFTCNEETSVNIAYNGSTPPTYEFTGSASGDIVLSWAKNSSATQHGAFYITALTIEFQSADGSYSVTYDGNCETSGTVPTDATKYTDENNTVTVLGNTGGLAKDHHTFGGWNTAADGTGTQYAAGETFTITESTRLYAKWNANTNTVTLPSADTYGTYTMSATNPVAYGTEVSLIYTQASGYSDYVATWSVNGTEIEGNTFTMPDEAVTVTVAVEKYIQPTAFEIALNNAFFGSEGTSNIDDAELTGSNNNTTITIKRNQTDGGGKLYVNASQIRLYNKNTMTVTAPSGYNLTSIEFIEPSSGKSWAGTNNTSSPTGYDDTNKKWTGMSNEVTITFGGTCRMVGLNITLAPSTLSATVTSAGWATWIPALNVEVPSGVSAYIVSSTTSDKAVLQELLVIPAGEPVVLKGAANTYTFNVCDDATLELNETDVNENLLAVSDETTTSGVYVLANGKNGAGFYKWNGGLLGADRVYLPASAVGAREFVGFGDEHTGIKDYTRETTTNNRCYNLNGQRVDAHQKGLYIVNGKKVIIK